MNLHKDTIYGTRIDWVEGRGVVKVTVASVLAPQSARSIELDLDDVDRLLACFEAAVDPVEDISEFFESAEGFSPVQAKRAARSFAAAANALAAL